MAIFGSKKDDQPQLNPETGLPEETSDLLKASNSQPKANPFLSGDSTFTALFDDDEEDLALKKAKGEGQEGAAHLQSYRGSTLEAELEESIRSLKKAYPMGGLKASRFITGEILMKAPEGYFSRFDDAVQKAVNWVQTVIADSGRASEIGAAQEDPTDEEKGDIAYRLVQTYAADYMDKHAPHRSLERAIIISMVCSEIIGFSVLEPLWRYERVNEIFVNGPFDVQVEIAGKMYRVPACRFRNRDHLTALIDRLYGAIGKVVAKTNPIVDGRLHDMSRMSVTHQAVSPQGPNFTIRRHQEEYIGPDKLVEWGAASPELMTFLGNLLYKGCSILVLGGTSSGKALRHSTPIPTPTGWTTMGELAPGDKLFDSAGKPCEALKKFPQPSRAVYKLTVDSGEELHCDLEHNWWVTYGEGEEPQVQTTAELLQALQEGRRPLIPLLQEPVAYEKTATTGLSPLELPVHPYLLGLWLADSNSPKRELLALNEDAREFNRTLEAAGSRHRLTKGALKCQWLLSKDCVRELAELSPTRRPGEPKALPPLYELASAEARRVLLAGLLDSSMNTSGNCHEFSSSNRELVDAFHRVASSLALKAEVSATEYRRQGNQEHSSLGRASWTVTVHSSEPLSLLPRQREAHEAESSASSAPYPRHSKGVVSIEQTGEFEEMSCITVSSPDSTYLAGDGYTVTHNTTMLGALSGFLRPDHRVLTLEDNLEMKIAPGKLLAAPMECVPSRKDVPGSGVDMRDLVRASLRLAPQAIIVGEVRDASAYDLCQAFNTGHYGMSTVHANSEFEGIYRMISLVSQAGLMSGSETLPLIAASFDVIVSVAKFPTDGSRRIVSVSEVSPFPERNAAGDLYLPLTPLWHFKDEGLDGMRVLGHFEQLNPISEQRRMLRRLDLEKDLTWEELVAISK